MTALQFSILHCCLKKNEDKEDLWNNVVNIDFVPGGGTNFMDIVWNLCILPFKCGHKRERERERELERERER